MCTVIKIFAVAILVTITSIITNYSIGVNSVYLYFFKVVRLFFVAVFSNVKPS